MTYIRLSFVLLFSLILSFSKAHAQNKDSIYVFPDKLAEFRGGPDKWTEFLSSNIKYPRQAHEAGIEGHVFLSFIVGKKGKVYDVAVIKSPGDLLSKEATRVLMLSPKWIPARKDGKKVLSRMQIRITFSIPKGGG